MIVITVSINKGGQAKTTFSVLITQYLLRNPKNVGRVACGDVDPTQMNFKNTLNDYGIEVPFVNKLEDVPEGIDYVVFDTSADLIESTPAIVQADILVCPIEAGKWAVEGLQRVEQVRGKRDMKVILNKCRDSGKHQQLEEDLRKAGYNVIGKVKYLEQLANNIDNIDDWHHRLSKDNALAIRDALENIF